LTSHEDEPNTEELRSEQARKSAEETARARQSDTDNEADQHTRRAQKSKYLKEKLEERAESERE
jgi:hypothetical protein